MIAADRLKVLGTLGKPHGIKGEISSSVDPGCLPVLEDAVHIFVDIDGLKVPFFITAVRRKSAETVLLTIKGINSEKDAATLSGKDFFVEKELIPDDGDDDGRFYIDDLIGFTVVAEGSTIGTVTDYDDSTANVLLKISGGGKEYLIPADENLIDDINPDTKTIEMSLPDGILDI